VRHKCDNPTCIRPSHLERGTKADNTADVKTRGRLRAPTGADNGRAKMTVVEVTEARHQHAMGVSGHQLARTFGLAASAMNSMLRGATWKHAA
jgi:hypothetical protein